MVKVRLTKNELKQQRDALARFNRYLPMLQLKKQQLQVEIGKVDNLIQKLNTEINNLRGHIDAWVDVFAEAIDLRNFIKIKNIKTETGNIAGVDIPIFSGIDFKRQDYDFLVLPFWVDKGIESLAAIMTLKVKLLILQKQRQVLKEELRVATQRVNLFEKVKIPQAQENIRVIHIHLGDLQTAGVVRGKIAKAKIESRAETANI